MMVAVPCKVMKTRFSITEQEVSCATKMRFLRRKVNKTRRDRIRNEIIRNHLKITPTEEKREERRLDQFGRTVRMQEDRMIKVYKMKISERRGKGRKHMYMRGGNQELFKEKGIKVETNGRFVEAKELLQRPNVKQA